MIGFGLKLLKDLLSIFKICISYILTTTTTSVPPLIAALNEAQAPFCNNSANQELLAAAATAGRERRRFPFLALFLSLPLPFTPHNALDSFPLFGSLSMTFH